MCEQLESRALLTVFTVTNSEAAGRGSLRAAIVEANKHAGPDTINFQIPGSGAHDIRVPAGWLPSITGQVTIDGYTQPGSARNTSTDPSKNNAVINVNLLSSDGSTLLNIGQGGSRSQIRGLGFYSDGPSRLHLDPSGIKLDFTRFVTVDGCVFGARGQSRLANAVEIAGGSNNTIGGDLAGTPALQNVMSNYSIGVHIYGVGFAKNNSVVNNIIGGEPGSSGPPSQRVGVWLNSRVNNNTIVQNILFKNITPYKNDGVGNVIENNTIVPR
jgi:hypothetical protein